ncbi:MAG TPA: peroxiredoxin family protein [Acidimicrobiales bacterium]|nr:peroxiredoxin family protein [Acidimicrobiales bacterium]
MSNDSAAPTQQEELDLITASVPEAIAARIDEGVADITTSGVAPGLAVGDEAPDFTLANAVGEPVTLSDLLATGPVVLTFYRGEWCPFCNVQLRHLERALPDFQKFDATLVAVSPQSPDHALSLTEKYDLVFPVLSDIDQSVAEAYRVKFTLAGDLEDLQVNVFGNDPRTQNADASRSLPVPATFVIDRHGVVRAAFVNADWRVRVDPQDVTAVLESL